MHVTTLLVLLSSFAAVFCSSGIVQAEEFKLSFTGATSIIEGSGEILAPDLIRGRGRIKFNVFVLLTSVQSQQEIDEALEETLNLPACKDLEDPPPGCRNHVGAQAWSFSVAVGSNALITGVSSTDENGEGLKILIREIIDSDRNSSTPRDVFENVIFDLTQANLDLTKEGSGQFPECANPLRLLEPISVCDVQLGQGAIAISFLGANQIYNRIVMENTVFRILRLEIEASIPEEGEGAVELRFLPGLKGEIIVPVNLVITGSGGSGFDPTIENMAIRLQPAPLTRLRGDCDSSGSLGISDAILVLSFLFLGEKVECEGACDVTGEGEVSLTDGLFFLQYLFAGGDLPGARNPGSTFPRCAYLDHATGEKCDEYSNVPGFCPKGLEK